MRQTFAAMAALFVIPLLLPGQSAYKTPRTPWGDPDLQGSWPAQFNIPMSRPANLKDKDFSALAIAGDELFGVVGAGAASQLVRLALPGERVPMATGADSYSVCTAGEASAKVTGLAIIAGRAYVAIAGLNVVRVIDLATGAKQADWPVPDVADLGSDAAGTLWAISC